MVIHHGMVKRPGKQIGVFAEMKYFSFVHPDVKQIDRNTQRIHASSERQKKLQNQRYHHLHGIILCQVVVDVISGNTNVPQGRVDFLGICS